MKAHILIVEDDKNAGQALKTLLDREGYQVDLSRDGQLGLEMALKNTYDLVLTDIVMPNLDGMSLFRRLKRERPETEIIMMTAHGTIEMAVEAMRDGAVDFLEKPLNIDRVRFQVEQAIKRKSLTEENKQLKKRLQEKFSIKNLLGNDSAIKKLTDQVRQIAASHVSVLILGESGTGKELVANSIHENSDRCDKPFVKINCAALPGELLQSELFGHTKGSFTGATSSRKGRFEEANGGTIFLDEIGDLPTNMQVKLLRVLQEGTFERIGDNTTHHTDIRLITATHVNLEKAIAEGKMREDFYYRIKGITLHIPPLRERKGDIPFLARHFLNQSGTPKTFSQKAITTFVNYPWPGNVRQLKNVCENLSVLVAGDEIQHEDLPPELIHETSTPTPHTQPTSKHDIELMKLSEVEDILIRKALEKTKGNKTEAARLLGIGLRTLYRKLEKMI